MAGLDHSKLFFVGMGYGSFIYDANWDLSVQNGKNLGKLFGGCAVLQNGYATFRWIHHFLKRMRRFLTEVRLRKFLLGPKNILSSTSVKKWRICFEK